MAATMVIPEELRKKYLERRTKDLEELSAAADQGLLEPFKRIGHQLKGNGPTYGYGELGELGKKMEEAADHNEPEAARACLKEFQAWITKHVR